MGRLLVKIYHSSNGDTWELEVQPTGEPVVIHTANPASGGAVTRTPVSEFSAIEGHGPEYQALRKVLSRLETAPGETPSAKPDDKLDEVARDCPL